MNVQHTQERVTKKLEWTLQECPKCGGVFGFTAKHLEMARATARIARLVRFMHPQTKIACRGQLPPVFEQH